jgi:Fe-S cluster biogenesis protein NfuA
MVENPSPQAGPREQIEQVIGMLRPFIQADGGDIEFVDFTPEGIVQVRLKGACVGCPGAVMTLRYGVEARLRECVPQVKGVVCVP